MRIRLSHLATSDLQDISDYTAEVWGEQQELGYLNTISSKLAEIASGKGPWRSRNDLFEGCQAASVGRYLIIFMIEGELVLVSRILHQSMDYPRHIFPPR